MNAIWASLIAGVFGTGFGGALAAFFGKKTDKVTSIFLAFAAGVMVSIVCFDMVPEAVKIGGIYFVVAGLATGIAGIMYLNAMVDRLTLKSAAKRKVHTTPGELYHDAEFIEAQKRHQKLFRAGIIMLAAIGLHNFPEGMAIGAGGAYNDELGFMIALMIGLHNIPEGMAISAPLVAGGVDKWKSIFLTMISGTPTVLGALLGLWLGGLSPTMVALALAIAGGAMLYVVFGEILPQTVILCKDRTASMVTLVGIIIGLWLIYSLRG